MALLVPGKGSEQLFHLLTTPARFLFAKQWHL